MNLPSFGRLFGALDYITRHEQVVPPVVSKAIMCQYYCKVTSCETCGAGALIDAIK